MVSFAATPPAGTVTARLVPVVSLALVPMFFTNAAAANAEAGASHSAIARVSIAPTRERVDACGAAKRPRRGKHSAVWIIWSGPLGSGACSAR